MTPAPEFSRRVAAAAVSETPMSISIKASEAERRALAKRFGLASLDRLGGRASLARAPARDGSGPAIRVEFAFEAEAVQLCVATLEPAPARLAETGLIAEFATANAPDGADADIAFDGVDPPEPLRGGAVDLGELLAQHLGLALDPYPRAPGAEFAAPPPEEPRAGPFAELAARLGTARRAGR